MAVSSPDRVALKELNDALEAISEAIGDQPTPTVIRRVRAGLGGHFDALEALRARTDPITMPKASFDPADPKAIGRVVSIVSRRGVQTPIGVLSA